MEIKNDNIICQLGFRYNKMHLPLCGSAIPMDLVLSLELGLPLNSITAKNPNFSGTTE